MDSSTEGPHPILMQFDIHQPFTTVHEALKFSAHLRFGTDTPNDTIEQFILEVMKLVELDSLSNALVGRPGTSGLSVEQRKRLTISVELVANPSIVFMDEPTSGQSFLSTLVQASSPAQTHLLLLETSQS